MTCPYYEPCYKKRHVRWFIISAQTRERENMSIITLNTRYATLETYYIRDIQRDGSAYAAIRSCCPEFNQQTMSTYAHGAYPMSISASAEELTIRFRALSAHAAEEALCWSILNHARMSATITLAYICYCRLMPLLYVHYMPCHAYITPAACLCQNIRHYAIAIVQTLFRWLLVVAGAFGCRYYAAMPAIYPRPSVHMARRPRH